MCVAVDPTLGVLCMSDLGFTLSTGFSGLFQLGDGMKPGVSTISML